MLKINTTKETNLNIYNHMVAPLISYGGETWLLKKRDWNIIQVAEMEYLRTVKVFTRAGQF
jgi:hypothetical protein